MTEDVLHEIFHAFLPMLAEHADYVLAGIVLWFVRTKLQVSNAQVATLLVELEALRAAANGEPMSSEEKRERAHGKANELNGVLVRPRAKRQAKLIESVRPGAKKEKN